LFNRAPSAGRPSDCGLPNRSQRTSAAARRVLTVYLARRGWQVASVQDAPDDRDQPDRDEWLGHQPVGPHP